MRDRSILHDSSIDEHVLGAADGPLVPQGGDVSVDDCQKAFEELKGLGVEFSQKPTQQPYGIDAGFRDPSGNAIRMMQAPAA